MLIYPQIVANDYEIPPLSSPPSFCSKKSTIDCPKCREEISLNDCFKDKAAENELRTATIRCTNQDCPWEGPSKFYMVGLLFVVYSTVMIRYPMLSNVAGTQCSISIEPSTAWVLSLSRPQLGATPLKFGPTRGGKEACGRALMLNLM